MDDNLICELCGKAGAVQLGGRTVCQECYCEYGSCCLEFGKDDLWTSTEPRVDDLAGVCDPGPASQRPAKTRLSPFT